MNNYKVYIHTCPNNKVYIGITSRDPEKRWKKGYGYIDNEHFYRAIKKYGWENIKHEILFENLEENEAYEKEKQLIKKYKSNNYKNGYNKSIGGEKTALGFKQTKEASKMTNICQPSIAKACRGSQKTAGGLHWKYLEK